ncbi:MAG: LysR family transcriptional regulator [Planctomycetota bacterium]|jgi:LysR family glycine cleavage system transcriptional activator
MQTPHDPTTLPATGDLEAFDAVLRHGSFTDAGRALGRTQGAISRRIASLESRLGRELFRREGHGVQPTRAGLRLGAELGGLLDRMRALLAAAGSEDVASGTLRLALLPTFGTTWLIPRLPSFLSAHPDVSLDLSSSVGPVDFRRTDLDAAIHYGTGVESNARAESLFEEVEVAVCSPAARSNANLEAPADLARSPLLHLSSRPSAWSDWFEHHGVETSGGSLPGPRFEHHLMVLEAARAGLGTALLPSFVAEDALRSGDLVEAVGMATPRTATPRTGRRRTGRRYWLLVPDRSLELQSLQAFRRWIRASIEDEAW